MHLFQASNTNDMAVQVYSYIQQHGVADDSRNGAVLRLTKPAMLRYTNHMYRANFTPNRDANIFFHIAEAMWMLEGRRDVAFLDMFNSNMKNFSDDGVSFNAAYGYRARKHFGFDQIEAVIKMLKNDSTTRQAVIQLWDCNDLEKVTKDKACNMLMVFSVNGDTLDMTVYNRSNDAIYGNVTGANPIHFSFFLQYVAENSGYQVGDLMFVTTNLHVYLDQSEHWQIMDWSEVPEIPNAVYGKLPGIGDISRLNRYLLHHKLCLVPFDNEYLDTVIKPLLNSYLARKFPDENPHQNHWDWLEQVKCPALKQAGADWYNRREA